MKQTKILFTSLLVALTCTQVQAKDSDGWFTPKEVVVYGGYTKSTGYENKLIGVELVPKKQPFKFAEILYNAEYHDSEYRGTPASYYRGVATKFHDSNRWINGGIKLRKTFNNGIFAKVGVGISHNQNKAYGRKISGGNWHFSPTYSVGYNITKNASVEYQYVHFSNAGTAPPNPGRDFHYIKLAYHFK